MAREGAAAARLGAEAVRTASRDLDDSRDAKVYRTRWDRPPDCGVPA